MLWTITPGKARVLRLGQGLGGGGLHAAEHHTGSFQHGFGPQGFRHLPPAQKRQDDAREVPGQGRGQLLRPFKAGPELPCAQGVPPRRGQAGGGAVPGFGRAAQGQKLLRTARRASFQAEAGR